MKFCVEKDEFILSSHLLKQTFNTKTTVETFEIIAIELKRDTKRITKLVFIRPFIGFLKLS